MNYYYFEFNLIFLLYKAVIDIKVKWSGKLNSQTVFAGISAGDDVVEQRKKSKDDRLNQVPRCYTEVSVCVFCSQFFHVQEDYRPTFQRITYNERKTEYLEGLERDKEYWDPLKMLEEARDKDETEEARLKEEELAMIQINEDSDALTTE
jgi:hypothetical protein